RRVSAAPASLGMTEWEKGGFRGRGRPRHTERLVTGDILLLERLGVALDCPLENALQVRDLLMRGLLKVRNKEKGLVALVPNRAQREYARNCTKRNIVLKARQMGLTTYVAARFFLQTITQPGTLTVQVAHSQESAEEIFKIVRRFWENLPKGMQRGAL